MNRKSSSSLAYPENPLNAMRELQELNGPAVEPIAKNMRAGGSNSATSSEVANTTSSVVANATSEQESPKNRRPKRGVKQRNEAPDGEGNLLNDALMQLLEKPYDADDASGPFTSTTVKIQTELWKRLNYASSLTNKPKQEVLADALRDYFRKLVKGQ